ncbi:MAG: ATP-binding protein [Anaerolineae bacterium]|nr:ATP-binding protein [Anaerolineae bacterium]
MDFGQLKKETSTLADFEKNLQDELDQAKRSLSEVSLMLEQSQAELNKLTQRNAAITGHLQQIQQQFDSVPRSDIQMTYNAALDAQQRLLVMRGQLEKLQNEQTHLEKIIVYYERVQNYLISLNLGGKNKSGKPSQASNMFEMLIDVQESERQRLSRQMHDGPVQALSNFIFQTEIVSRYFDLDVNKAREELTVLRTSAMTTFQNVRDFILELRPMMLDDLGLLPTIRRYVDAFKDQSGLDVNLNIIGQEQRFDQYIEVMIFRAIQELVGNAARHNPDRTTKLKIKVQINIGDNLVRVEVSDNGKGFVTETLGAGGGLGLKLIRERVEMLGGSMEVESTRGQGCRVSFQIPFQPVSQQEPVSNY